MSKKKDKKQKQEQRKEKQTKKTRQNNKDVVNKVVFWGFLLLLSLGIIVLSLYWIPGEIHYEITETYSFSGEETESLNLMVLLPTTGNYQEVLSPEIIWPGSWETESAGSMDVLRLKTELEPGQTAVAVIKYQVNLWQGQVSWYADPMTSANLSSAELVQSDHPEIVSQADALSANGDKSATARNIFDFTIRHLETPDTEVSILVLSALEVYQTGVGDDVGQANLMAALCRASEIPSKVVTGLVMSESVPFISVSSTYDHPAKTHAWVEMFVDEAWTLADPNRSGNFYQRDLFGWTDGKHLVYSEASQESEVFSSLMQEAEEDGTWIAGMSAPLHFVAWSEASIESVQLIPTVSVRKTWDARLIMAFSLVLIIGLLGWLFQDNNRTVRNNDVTQI